MAATKEDLSRWFDKGILLGREFMIVVCDTFDYEDYPIYCRRKNFDRIYKASQGNMQRVVGVYDLTQDKAGQIAEDRCFRKPEAA